VSQHLSLQDKKERDKLRAARKKRIKLPSTLVDSSKIAKDGGMTYYYDISSFFMIVSYRRDQYGAYRTGDGRSMRPLVRRDRAPDRSVDTQLGNKEAWESFYNLTDFKWINAAIRAEIEVPRPEIELHLKMIVRQVMADTTLHVYANAASASHVNDIDLNADNLKLMRSSMQNSSKMLDAVNSSVRLMRRIDQAVRERAPDPFNNLDGILK
jgi:hypothetical protein